MEFNIGFDSPIIGIKTTLNQTTDLAGFKVKKKSTTAFFYPTVFLIQKLFVKSYILFKVVQTRVANLF